MSRILVADDDKAICDQVAELLEMVHHTVERANTGTDAIEFLRSVHVDLAILDWNMPGLPGVEVCRTYRAEGGKTPILMLTGRGEIDEKEYGFDAGADDYLTKPFEFRELMARVKAILRRPPVFAGNSLEVGNLCLDCNTHTVRLDKNEIKLLPLEFNLLEFLMKHPGQPFSAEALMERVWSVDSDPSPETVRTYIKTLRKKIKSDAGGPNITTVYGVGYKIDP